MSMVGDARIIKCVPDGKMFWMTSHAFRMTSHERAIYRAGSLTLSFCPVIACHVSSKTFVKNKLIAETSSALELFAAFPLIAKQD